MPTPTCDSSIFALVMAGGAGTRFWPASRNALPKQLLSLAGQRTMLQATVDRLESLVAPDRFLIMTNHRLVDQVAGQLSQLDKAYVLGEPCKRDTAPCIGLAALLFAKRDPQAVMLVTPSDHVIDPTAHFQAAVRQGVKWVASHPHQLVTFGIRPTYASSSFGYIERAEKVDSGDYASYRVSRFREKPSVERAREYLNQGTYYWNSGIFVWRAGTLIDLLRKHEPEMMQRLQVIADTWGRPEFPAVFADEFANVQGKSIDYAVMEKAEDVTVIEAPFSWDDVGSWQAIARLNPHDANDNTLQGRCLTMGSYRTLIRTTEDHLVVAIGVEDLMVIHTPDATLIVHKDQEEYVRNAVREMEERGWHDVL